MSGDIEFTCKLKCPFQKQIIKRKYSEWIDKDKDGKTVKHVLPEAEFHTFADCLESQCPYYEKYNKCSRVVRRFGE